MKIGIIGRGAQGINETAAALKKSFSGAELCLFAPGGAEIKLPGVKMAGDCAECISGADVIVNLVSGEEWNTSILKGAAGDVAIEPDKAGVIIDAVSIMPALKFIDDFAAAYKEAGSKAIIINTGEPIDFVTSYLAYKHNIVSYGLSPKAVSTLDTLLKAAKFKVNAGKVSYRMAGVKNNLFICEIKDASGKDLYPELRKAAAGETLNVKRVELTRDSMKSLKFYGYYHSADAVPSSATELVAAAIQALTFDKESVIYLNTVNKGYISGLDEAPVEVPCRVCNFTVKPEKCELPLQCALAVNDYIGAELTATKALAIRSAEVFKRAVKLDPYLASLLTLEEADRLAGRILAEIPAAGIMGRE